MVIPSKATAHSGQPTRTARAGADAGYLTNTRDPTAAGVFVNWRLVMIQVPTVDGVTNDRRVDVSRAARPESRPLVAYHQAGRGATVRAERRPRELADADEGARRT